jgi:hypothetical protein
MTADAKKPSGQPELEVPAKPVDGATRSAEPSVESSAPAMMVACRVCQEPIRKGARKCIHCNSMLDWHGWLGISETALALLVALVSVVGATAPRVVALLTPQSSNLRLSIRQVFSNNLEVLALNQGHQNSQLLSAKISAKTDDGRQLDAIPLQINGVPNVPGEQGTLFELAIPLSAIPTFLDWPHPKIQSATLSVLINEFRKQPETREIDVPVEYFRLLCRATEDADTLLRHPGQTVDNRASMRCMPAPK